MNNTLELTPREFKRITSRATAIRLFTCWSFNKSFRLACREFMDPSDRDYKLPSPKGYAMGKARREVQND